MLFCCRSDIISKENEPNEWDTASNSTCNYNKTTRTFLPQTFHSQATVIRGHILPVTIIFQSLHLTFLLLFLWASYVTPDCWPGFHVLQPYLISTLLNVHLLTTFVLSQSFSILVSFSLIFNFNVSTLSSLHISFLVHSICISGIDNKHTSAAVC